jgi:hypothetical protein
VTWRIGHHFVRIDTGGNRRSRRPIGGRIAPTLEQAYRTSSHEDAQVEGIGLEELDVEVGHRYSRREGIKGLEPLAHTIFVERAAQFMVLAEPPRG